MNTKQIDRLFDRMRRLSESLHIKAGPGTGWSYTLPTGEQQTYHITNVRGPDELEDNFANLAVWVWSVKDYIKEFAVVQGFSASLVEKYVNKNSDLCLCADIANLFKHGKLRTSRSGKFPQPMDVRYRIPHTAMKKLTFTGGNELEIDVKDPAGVDISLPIQDADGNDLGDGFELLKSGLAAWDKLYSRLKRFPRGGSLNNKS
jgi:hypothetical protein